MNPYQYIVSFAKGVGGIIRDASLILRPNFNDMANLSLTSPSNGSAVFNGSSDYVKANSAASASMYACAFWSYTAQPITSSSTSTTIIDVNGSAAASVLKFGASTGLLSGETFTILGESAGPTYWRVALNQTIPAGWNHFSITWTGATYDIYLNGSKQSVITSGTAFVLPVTTIVIGREEDTASQYFIGNLANVAVWNRALTSDEINSIMWKRYDLLTAGESTGLVTWYALDDITGTSVPDSTGTYNATAY